MSFVDLMNLGDSPKRECPERFGGLLAVFKPKLLEGHDRLGYSFRANACHEAVSYDPDVCVPGDIKMDPTTFGSPKEAVLSVLQSAFTCSSGSTIEELRELARDALDDNLERAIEADFVAYLSANDTPQGGPIDAKCALGEAAQFLASTGECGRGLIIGPVSWFVQLESLLIWNQAKGYHTDFVGNVVIPHVVDNNTVFALDLSVDIKVSDVLVLDDLAPGVRLVNDKVVRAELLYTIAIDSCQIGSWTVAECCGCGSEGGGGGGGGVQNPCNCQFQVTNFPAVQDVNVVGPDPFRVFVDNFAIPNDDELLCDDVGIFFRRNINFPDGTTVVVFVDVNGDPYVPVGTIGACGSAPTLLTQHKDVTPGNDWTPADIGTTATSISYTVWVGTATVTDGNGTVIAGIPSGHSATWNNDLEGAVVTPQVISADPGSRVYVNWTELA